MELTWRAVHSQFTNPEYRIVVKYGMILYGGVTSPPWEILLILSKHCSLPPAFPRCLPRPHNVPKPPEKCQDSYQNLSTSLENCQMLCCNRIFPFRLESQFRGHSGRTAALTKREQQKSKKLDCCPVQAATYSELGGASQTCTSLDENVCFLSHALWVFHQLRAHSRYGKPNLPERSLLNSVNGPSWPWWLFLFSWSLSSL